MVEGNAVNDRLFTELFETRHYDKYSFPVKNMSKTIDVQLGIKLLKIADMVCIQPTRLQFTLSSLWHIDSKSPLIEFIKILSNRDSFNKELRYRRETRATLCISCTNNANTLRVILTSSFSNCHVLFRYLQFCTRIVAVGSGPAEAVGEARQTHGTHTHTHTEREREREREREKPYGLAPVSAATE